VSFKKAKVLNSNEVLLVFVFFFFNIFCSFLLVVLEKSLPNLRSVSFSFMLYSVCFIGLPLSWRSISGLSLER